MRSGLAFRAANNIMPKRKLMKFEQVSTFGNCFFLSFEQSQNAGLPLKGKWHSDYFKNNNPIVLELGCGKGEYTVGLAKRYPDKNFIGVDIKGNRIWTGAKEALETNLHNVAFIRTRIDFIEACFAKGEVQEIWITFPDPQPQLSREKKRLTYNRFLDMYKIILKPGGIVHLKTDNDDLHLYTADKIAELKLKQHIRTEDLYHSPFADEVLSIKTYYEKKYLKDNKNINYLKFSFE